MKLKVVDSGSKGNCHILTAENGKKLLLDCGPSWKRIRTGLDNSVANVVGCLVTHKHKDHSNAIFDVVRYGIPVYCNRETRNEFYNATCVKKFLPRTVESFTFIPFDLPHNSGVDDLGNLIPCENYGYLITNKESGEKLLYITDAEMCRYTFKSQMVEHFLVECNHTYEDTDSSEIKYEHSIRGHMSLDTVLRFLEVNVTEKTKNIIFCHLSKAWADEEKILASAKEKFPDVNIYIAKKGVEIEL